MATSTLSLHRGGRDVAREELFHVPAPPPTSTWFPIAHGDVLAAASATLEGAGFRISRARLSLSHGDARFFGTLDLEAPIRDGVALAVGIRNSTDKSFPIGFCCGTRVFICDNLAFTAEIVVSKKHTRFGNERYQEGIAQAVSGLPQYQEAAGCWIEKLQDWNLSEDAANSYLLQAYETGIIGTRLLPLVLQEWRAPKRDEYRPRTGWSLFNCMTDVLGRTKQATQPAAAALATMRLSRLLMPPIDVEVTADRLPGVPVS